MHKKYRYSFRLVSFALMGALMAACHDKSIQENVDSPDKLIKQQKEVTVLTNNIKNLSVNLPIISYELPKVKQKPTCYDNDDIKVPCGGGIKPTVSAIQHTFDVFSWESFIALNWPANNTGEADTTVVIGDKPGAMTVWQRYKESRDIFLPGGTVPLGWAEETLPPAVCADGGDHAFVLKQAKLTKSKNVLDESGEPFNTGPLIDQNGNYTRYEILTNKVMFDYIKNNGLYSVSGQREFFSNGGNVDFPESSGDKGKFEAEYGSILIKSAWKVIGKSDDASKFHTTQAYVYDNPDEYKDVALACSLQTVGLVGIHIATKLEGLTQWAWSTFEHVDNVPTAGTPVNDMKVHYNYYNPSCSGNDCSINQAPVQPWNPAVKTKPGQIERIIPISKKTKALNQRYQAALKEKNPNSVWANYELISTQWPRGGSTIEGKPSPAFLANTTMETYIQGDTPKVSSSCIGCHVSSYLDDGGNHHKADFTFILKRAQ